MHRITLWITGTVAAAVVLVTAAVGLNNAGRPDGHVGGTAKCAVTTANAVGSNTDPCGPESKSGGTRSGQTPDHIGKPGEVRP